MTFVGEMTTQQKNVYTAQQFVTCLSKSFTDIEDVQRYADSLTSSVWWEKNYGHVTRIDAIPHNTLKCSVASCTDDGKVGIIAIAPNMMTQRTVLHEIAHCIDPSQGHNSTWARTFLTLVYFAVGSEEYQELREAFVNNNVDIG